VGELTSLSVIEAAKGLRKGDFSSQDLVQACLKRIEKLEPDLKTFITIQPESAEAGALSADHLIANWRKDPTEPLPPLTGIPLAVKDVLCVSGMPCTCGSRILEGFVPPYNAVVVERLTAAGAIITGKTNTDEFAMGSSTENSAFFTTRNPWNPDRVPGGSSGGSAAAVAGRLVPAALGTDTGGSVRQPASFCGVTGIKPTYGRVSRYGLVAFGSSLDVVGAFGRSAEDTGIIYSIMAGYDEKDATTVDLPVPELQFEQNASERPLEGLRIGVPDEYFITGIQAEVDEAVKRAVQILESLGARALPISLPHTEYAVPVYYLIAPSEASANLARYDGIRFGPRSEGDNMWDVFYQTRGERFGSEVKRRIMLGTYALSAGYYDAYYGQAQRVRTLIRNDFDLAFEKVDMIAAPVTPSTAFPVGEHAEDPLSMYLEDILTLPANLAGIPGLSFPVGFDTQGLPIGMQLMGPHFKENSLFQAAHAYQQVENWHRRLPAL
jgi:aspartyl-tRNA(Asn)/glutamyl-tRNA(Gln) amidotransferase subunit A